MAKMRVQPLGENVLVRLESKEKKTASGLYLPENAAGERGQQGTVVAVGPDKEIKVKKGDTVIFKRYGTSEELKIDGIEHVLLASKDVLAIVSV
jgi:chaperonin GroES